MLELEVLEHGYERLDVPESGAGLGTGRQRDRRPHLLTDRLCHLVGAALVNFRQLLQLCQTLLAAGRRPAGEGGAGPVHPPGDVGGTAEGDGRDGGAVGGVAVLQLVWATTGAARCGEEGG